jgi:Flp pilus assembly protein TadG
MQSQKLLARIYSGLREFGAARCGNVAITFALAIVPILGAVGAAVDYSRANAVKVKLQTALDATALMLSREAANESSDQLQANALKYFTALYNQTDTQAGPISASYTASGGAQVFVKGSVYVPTDFAKFVGVDTITVGSASTVKWGTSRLRVALVLDNTGSMAQSGKIDALKNATNKLLNQLKDAATNNGDVYVSIIPFVKDVNVGSNNFSSNWIDWTDWDNVNGSCSQSKYVTQTDCLNANGNKTWTVQNHNTWNGCVVDRGGKTAPDPNNYDTNVVAPTTSIKATLFSAEQYSSCPQAAKGLSYDWSGMSTLVNNMSPGGNTNQAIGLALGWMSLTGGGPFTAPAMDPNYTYSQVIILLTDGLNTQDRWYSDQASIDIRQKKTCDNIKAAGITLYTIQVNTGGDPTSTLLQNCASDSDKFFLLTSADAIVTTFNTIGTNISKLYVAK